jgi:ubiquinone/menaquinone biosynthesis C-methylase UbiE
MMEIAECEYRKLPGLVKLVQADASATEFRDQEFDAVVCLRLLHRVPDTVRESILTELNRISRRYVIVSVGLTSRLQQIRRQVRHLTTGISTVPYPITKVDLISQFTRAGLRPLYWVPVLCALSSEWVVICEKRTC